MASSFGDKKYYKIGEVASIIDVNTHTIRYWETKFPMLRLQKTSSNHRIFEKGDIELLLQIKRLLQDEGYSVQGAIVRLREEREQATMAAAAPEPPPEDKSPPPNQKLASNASPVSAKSSKAGASSNETMSLLDFATGLNGDAQAEVAEPASPAMSDDEREELDKQHELEKQLLIERAEIAERRAADLADALTEAQAAIDRILNGFK